MDNRARIKICGLRTAEGVEAALAAGADLIGFVFVATSPRAVDPGLAAELCDQAAGRADCVGLVADAPVPEIRKLTDRVPLNYVQLHGRETQGTIGAVAAATDLPVIAARGISEAADLPEAGLQPTPAYYLYDAKPPSGTTRRGGHGHAFDWTLLNDAPDDVPWLLAGGLTPENVGEAIAACRDLPGFSGVDVSSGVERLRGEKDPDLIAAFVLAAQAAMAADRA